MDQEEEEVSNNNNNDMISISYHNNNNYMTTLRIDKEKWLSFRRKVEKLGYSANTAMNLLIDSFLLGKMTVEGKTISFNIQQNIQPIQNKTLNLDVKEYINQTLLDKYMKLMEAAKNQKQQFGHYKEKAFRVAQKIKNPKPETFEKIRKLTEF